MVSTSSLDTYGSKMHKYYKKFSSSAVSLLDPQFIGQQKDLFLNELGSTIGRINKKCGEICTFENPSLLGGKKVKVKKKAHRERHPCVFNLKDLPVEFAKSIEQSLKTDKRHRDKADIPESHKIKDDKEHRSKRHSDRHRLKKNDSSELSRMKYARENSKRDANENAMKTIKRHKEYEANKDSTKEKLQTESEEMNKVTHLYEDSKTEIYFVNDTNSRKRKLKSSKCNQNNDQRHDKLKNDRSKDHHSVDKGFWQKLYGSKTRADSYGKHSESTHTRDQPITIATLSQLQHLFFRQPTKSEDTKTDRHKKHSKDHVETHHKPHKRKHNEFHNIQHVHRVQMANKNLMSESKDSGVVRDNILIPKKSAEVSHDRCSPPSNEQESHREHKKEKHRHKKDDRISLRFIDKTKKHRKKRDKNSNLDSDSNVLPQSLFQNLHVNFGKCILMEDGKHKSKCVNESLLTEDLTESRIKHWMKTQCISNLSNDSLKKIESDRKYKSETSLPRASFNQISPTPSKLYKKRSNYSGKTNHASVKNAEDLFTFEKELENQLSTTCSREKTRENLTDETNNAHRISRSKSSAPFLTEAKSEASEAKDEPDKTHKKLSESDYGYFADKLKQALGDSLKEVEDHFSLSKDKSQKSLTSKEKLKRLVRTSYACIFEYPTTTASSVPRSTSKSGRKSRKKNEPQMVFCDNTVSIESTEKKKSRMHLQNVNLVSLEDRNCFKDDEINIEISCIKNKSKEIVCVRNREPTPVEVETVNENSVETKLDSSSQDKSVQSPEIEKEKSADKFPVSRKFPSLDLSSEDRVGSSKRLEDLSFTVFHIVDIPPMYEKQASFKLKPSIKKVTFPDEFEEIVERRKRTSSPFRRYYRYTNNSVDLVDGGSQTLSAVFLSDYNVGVSDSYEDELEDDQMPAKHMPRRAIPTHIESRIPVKITSNRSRQTKQDTLRRRDLKVSSDSSSHISTSGSSKDFISKNGVQTQKQSAWVQKSFYINRASSPLDATMRNAPEDCGYGDERRTVRTRAEPSRYIGYHAAEPQNRSSPSSIRTDSELHSIKSSRSRSSWNVIKNPVDIASHSVVENRHVSKSTFKCSENSIPMSTARSLCHQQYRVDDDGKIDGRILIDELVKRLANIRQEVPSPYEYNYTTRVPRPEIKRTKNKKKQPSQAAACPEKYGVSKSLSPPKSKLPIHFCYIPSTLRAKSFIEEQNSKRRSQKECKSRNSTPRNKKINRLYSKPLQQITAEFSTEGEEANVVKNESRVTDLSIIASNSETNMKPPMSPKGKLKSQSRMSSRITLDNYSPPSRLPKPLQKPVERSPSKKENLANPNSSTLFLTKDYKDKAHLNSYQRRKNYDMNIRKGWKIRSSSEENKLPLRPQVFEVRYVTVSNDSDTQNITYVTRSAQNTTEQGCQVSNSTSIGQNSIQCSSMEEIADGTREFSNLASSPVENKEENSTEKKYSGLARGSKASVQTKKNDKYRKKKKKKLNRELTKSKPAYFTLNPTDTDVITLHTTVMHSDFYSEGKSSLGVKAETEEVTRDVPNVNKHISKHNILKAALNLATNLSFDCKKDLLKNWQYGFLPKVPFEPLALKEEDSRSITFSDRIMVKKDGHVTEKSENSCRSSCLKGFGDYLCNALFCCCVCDTDEPPTKKRKYSKSKKKSKRSVKKKQSAKKMWGKEEQVTELRVQLERNIDLNYVKSGLDLKIVFGDKCHNQKDLDCHQNVTVSDKDKFYPVEWFRNVDNFVYHEQNGLSALPSISFGSLDNNFGSEEGTSKDKVCSIDEEQSNSSGFISQQNSSEEEMIKKDRVFKSKSDIAFINMKTVESDSLASNLHTATSLSTSYSSCLPNSVDGNILENDEILHEDVNLKNADFGSNKRSELAECLTTREIDQSMLNLDTLKTFSLTKVSPVTDSKSCDLLSSRESGYTSLSASKRPSPTNFFRRRSIMELFKFPLERKKSKCLIDINSCIDCSTNNDTKKIFFEPMGSSSSSDDFLRVNRFNKMNKDCQLYAHKVRMLSSKKKDGMYEENDNYREISLDVLLGRSSRCGKNRSSHALALSSDTNNESDSQSLIILDDTAISNISLVESSLEEDLSSTRDEQNLHNLTENGSSSTKSSKSDGMLLSKREIQQIVQSTRSDSFVKRNENDNMNIDTKRLSFHNFSTSLSTKMADREFFQKLLLVYEKQNEIAERLYHDEVFFKTEMEALEQKKNQQNHRKKSKGIFSMFKKKRKNSTCLVGDGIYERSTSNSESTNESALMYLDDISSESCKDDWVSVASDKALSTEELEGASPEAFRQLAHKVKRHFGQMVQAVNANKFVHDDIKLNGFLKLLERIEQGDMSICQKNDISTLEEKVRDQVTHCFGFLYEAVMEFVNGKKTKITQCQLELIKLFSARYGSHVNAYMHNVAACIGNGTISTEQQLKAAVIHLMSMDGKLIDQQNFEKCIIDNT